MIRDYFVIIVGSFITFAVSSVAVMFAFNRIHQVFPDVPAIGLFDAGHLAIAAYALAMAAYLLTAIRRLIEGELP